MFENVLITSSVHPVIVAYFYAVFILESANSFGLKLSARRVVLVTLKYFKSVPALLFIYLLLHEAHKSHRSIVFFPPLMYLIIESSTTLLGLFNL